MLGYEHIDLKNMCKKLAEEQPVEDLQDKFRIFETSNNLQIVFQSVGCQWQRNGSCIMCSYGKASQNVSPEEVDLVFHSIPESSFKKVLVLDCFGSILDVREMPQASFERILYWLNKIEKVKYVFFETRPETITKEKIDYIKKALPNKSISFEIGIEAVSPYRRGLLCKDIDDELLSSKFELAHDNGCNISSNVLIGVPFMSVKDRIQITVDTVNWIVERQTAGDDIVLFPINPKPGTVLWSFYEKGDYQIPFHWEIVETLSRINPEVLNRTYLAYTGNKGNGIHPFCCVDCHDEGFFESFYEKFHQSEDRYEVVCQAKQHQCDCKETFYNQILPS